MAIEETRHPDIFMRRILKVPITTRLLNPGEIVDLGVVDRASDGTVSHHILKVDPEGKTAQRSTTHHIPQGEAITPSTLLYPTEQSFISQDDIYTVRGCLGLVTGSNIMYRYVQEANNAQKIDWQAPFVPPSNYRS